MMKKYLGLFFLLGLVVVVALHFTINAHGAGLSISPTLINGTPVTDNSFEEVVRISVKGTDAKGDPAGWGCSAEIAGDRVLLTAAHCVERSTEVAFLLRGAKYTGKGFMFPDYPIKDLDLGVVILDSSVPSDVKRATVGGSLKLLQEVILLGYGCTKPGGGGGNDGILRKGTNRVTGFSGYDVVSQFKNAAALCYGDSGGPLYVTGPNGERLLVGINSKGNIRDKNYNLRLDLAESRGFLDKMAADHGVEICGINKECLLPPPEAASCVASYLELVKKTADLGMCLGVKSP